MPFGHLNAFNRVFCAAAALLVSACTAATGASQISQSSDVAPAQAIAASRPAYALVIHGGAGTIDTSKYSQARIDAYHAQLRAALAAGEAVLKDGGESLDAITAAIMVMENAPQFNAAHGAVLTNEGKAELDASIMRGDTLDAGAVTGVTTTKNPILLARAVMEKSPHVMMMGRGANTFSTAQGLEQVDNSYFITERRKQALERAKAREMAAAIAGVDRFAYILPGEDSAAAAQNEKFGTVGAAALDMNGNLAAGTSTGGMTNKRFGRVGDAPIIGAGTYANNASCAVSATGHGEYFMRATVARDICARMEFGGASLADAANAVVMEQLVDMGGDGGIIAVDKDGNTALIMNSKGMYRGSVVAGGAPYTAIMAGE